MAEDLENSIFIYFITAERSTLTNFAGTGANRKRSPVMTRLLAEHIDKKLGINYTFKKDGVPVPRDERIEFLYRNLMAVPDDIAKASGGRTTDTQTARKTIAHGLYLALELAFEREYESQDFLDPASPRYIHRNAKE